MITLAEPCTGTPLPPHSPAGSNTTAKGNIRGLSPTTFLPLPPVSVSLPTTQVYHAGCLPLLSARSPGSPVLHPFTTQPASSIPPHPSSPRMLLLDTAPLDSHRYMPPSGITSSTPLIIDPSSLAFITFVMTRFTLGSIDALTAVHQVADTAYRYCNDIQGKEEALIWGAGLLARCDRTLSTRRLSLSPR